MDIYLTCFSSQILTVILILLFAILAYFRPRFIALLLPVILPLYLVKIYFRLQDLFNFPGYFLPQFSETPVIRPGLESRNLIIPTNLLEILLILFLLLNIPLIIRGFKLIFNNYWGKFLLISLFILLLSVAISTIYAMNLRVALGAAKSWFILPILLFFAFLPLLENPDFRRKMLYSFLISGAVISFASVLFILENIYTYDGRLTGIYLSPNHLAMAIIPGILALFTLLFIFPNKKPKIVLSVLLFPELLVLYFTYSYGAWLALLLATGLILILYQGRAELPKKPLSYRLIIPLILVILGVSQLGNPKLQHIINGDYYSSLHSRLAIWNSALLISRDHPFTGIGTDNFQQAYLDYQKYFAEPYLEWSAPQPHNIFLAFQTQLGLLGTLSFLSLIIFTFLKSNNNPNDPLKFFALAYLAYIIFHGLVDTPYFKNDLAVIFWVSIAILWAEKIAQKEIQKT